MGSLIWDTDGYSRLRRLYVGSDADSRSGVDGVAGVNGVNGFGVVVVIVFSVVLGFDLLCRSMCTNLFVKFWKKLKISPKLPQ